MRPAPIELLCPACARNAVSIASPFTRCVDCILSERPADSRRLYLVIRAQREFMEGRSTLELAAELVKFAKG